MSETIKYRAIPMHCNKWVYGYYVYKPLADVHLIVSECTVPYKTETYLEETIVRRETVQQLHHSWWRGAYYRNCNIPFAVFDSDTDFNAMAKWFRWKK